MKLPVCVALVALLASGSQARVLLQGTGTQSALSQAVANVRAQITSAANNAGVNERQVESAATDALIAADGNKDTVPLGQAIQDAVASVEQETGGPLEPTTQRAIENAVVELYNADSAAAPAAVDDPTAVTPADDTTATGPLDDTTATADPADSTAAPEDMTTATDPTATALDEPTAAADAPVDERTGTATDTAALDATAADEPAAPGLEDPAADPTADPTTTGAAVVPLAAEVPLEESPLPDETAATLEDDSPVDAANVTVTNTTVITIPEDEAELDPLTTDTNITTTTAVDDIDVVAPDVIEPEVSPAVIDTGAPGTIATTNLTTVTAPSSSAAAVTASSVILGVVAAVVAAVL